MSDNMFQVHNGDTQIYFNEGKFDKYCVYVERLNRYRFAPTDDEYFNWILRLSRQYGTIQVWDDFCKIFDFVSPVLDETGALKLIYQIDSYYNTDTVVWWIVFYMTMVAECNKENTILGKRIKKLGVYNILFDKYPVEYVTTYMRNKKWQELDELMQERGI